MLHTNQNHPLSPLLTVWDDTPVLTMWHLSGHVLGKTLHMSYACEHPISLPEGWKPAKMTPIPGLIPLYPQQYPPVLMSLIAPSIVGLALVVLVQNRIFCAVALRISRTS
jgi:hypothetical protein